MKRRLSGFDTVYDLKTPCWLLPSNNFSSPKTFKSQLLDNLFQSIGWYQFQVDWSIITLFCFVLVPLSQFLSTAWTCPCCYLGKIFKVIFPCLFPVAMRMTPPKSCSLHSA